VAVRCRGCRYDAGTAVDCRSRKHGRKSWSKVHFGVQVSFGSGRKSRVEQVQSRVHWEFVGGTFRFLGTTPWVKEGIRFGTPRFGVSRGGPVEYVLWFYRHGSGRSSQSSWSGLVFRSSGSWSGVEAAKVPLDTNQSSLHYNQSAKLKLFANMLRKVGCGSGKRLHCARWNVGNDNECSARPGRSPFIPRS
jgi:hypothetical protein